MAPVVSVIVPVRDNAAGVRELLERLGEQTVSRSRFEVVIGDDGSAPGSLAGIDTADGWVRVIPGPRRTSYAARNRAVAAARGGVLAFCDSDCLPDAGWLEEGLVALGDADVVAGEVLFALPPRPTAWSLLSADMYLDQERNVLLSRAVTANLLVRQRTFAQLAGFDESLPSGGDYDFVARAVAAGARLAYAPSAVIRHPTIDRRKSFLRKVWTTNRWGCARRVRAGRPPAPGIVIGLIPFVGVAQARRKALRPPLRLQRPRLAASGLRPSLGQELRALTVLYFVVAYVAKLAQARGWFDGRRLLRDGEGPSFADVSGGQSRGPVHAAGEPGMATPHPAQETGLEVWAGPEVHQSPLRLRQEEAGDASEA